MTVIDEDEDEPFVNVVIDVEEGFVKCCIERDLQTDQHCSTIEDSDKSFKSSFADVPEIPRRPKKAAQTVTNGNGPSHEKHALDVDGANEAEPKGVKRQLVDDDGPPSKKAKMAESAGVDGVVVVEEAGGAIIIDDD